MADKQNSQFALQEKSHKALLKLLNNIGVVGAILAAIADLAFVLIMVLGINIDVELKAIIIFAVVNALIGILINILLRYQGQKYAEVENEDLCKRFYNKRAKEKKYMSMGTWMGLKSVQDIIIKGGTTSFSIFGIIYVTIQGSKNPIQILITFATLVLFACFGLMAMNSAYCRFYNIQVPYMKMKLEEREKDVENKLQQDTAGNRREDLPQSAGTGTQEPSGSGTSETGRGQCGSGDQDNQCIESVSITNTTPDKL